MRRTDRSRWIDVVGKSYERNHVNSQEEGERHETEKARETAFLWQSDDHDEHPDDDDERQKTHLKQQSQKTDLT